MDRQIPESQAQIRSYDAAWQARQSLYALGALAGDLLGSTGTVVTGLGASASSPASLTIALAAGNIYQLAAVDTNAFGPLPADANQTMMQGYALAQAVALTTSGLTTGQSRWALIWAEFSQTDEIPGDDPTGGLLNYLNTANPSGPPYSGPANDNTPQNTRRLGVCTIGVTYGTVATTGSEAPPNAPGGAVGLYLVDLAYGQTAVTSGEILTAYPSAGSNVSSSYPAAPFLAGLAQKPTLVPYAGNPNGNVAGTTASGSTLPIFCLNTLSGQLYYCVTGGAKASAVWGPLGNPPPVGTQARLKVTGGGTAATVTADELVVSNELGSAATTLANVALSLNLATVGAGGMDTGSPPSSADLSIYLIYNPTTQTAALLACAGSESNGTIYAGSHLPAGYTLSALVCAIVTNGSAQLPSFTQLGRAVYLAGLSEPLINGTATTATSVSCAAGVPACALTIGGALTLTPTTAGQGYIAGANNVGISSGTGWQVVSGNVAGATQTVNFSALPLLTPQIFWYLVAGSGTVQFSVTINNFTF